MRYVECELGVGILQICEGTAIFYCIVFSFALIGRSIERSTRLIHIRIRIRIHIRIWT